MTICFLQLHLIVSSGGVAMNAREERGRIIADTCPIRSRGKLYEVPSQSNNGTYLVNLQREFCSCPDHAELGITCKHIYAVRFSMTKTVQHADGSATIETTELKAEVRRKTYRQDWPNYNRAQVNEHKRFQMLLYDLCRTLPAPAPKPGRPPIHPSDAAFTAIYKVYSTMSARRFMGDLDEARLSGFIDHKPHFNSVLNFFDTESATATLTAFIELSAAPLRQVECNFAVDSSGFSGCRYARWFDEKWGKPRQKIEWVKVHAMCGVKTNVVTSALILEKDAADSPQFPKLVADTATRFDIDEVSADKAYGSRENFKAVDAVGGTFFPAFKKNATGGVGGSYEKAYHYFCLNRDEYLQHYHQRSNVESTFSMLKRKFGEALRSKTDLAMKNEVYAKIVCHNICCLISAMYELNIVPSIQKEAAKITCTKTKEPAQLNLFGNE